MTKLSRKLLVCSVLLALTFISIGAIAAPDWMNRPGTITHAIAQPDGIKVYLDAVIVDKIKAQQNPPYFVVHESWSFKSRIVVKVSPPQVLRPWQTVDIEGSLGTLPNGERAVLNPRVIGYFDKNGQLLYHGPLTKGIGDPTSWQWKTELNSTDSTSASVMSETPPNPNEPTAAPASPPLYCATINAAKSQAAGTIVELQCRPISSTGTGFFVMGEDSSADTIKVYWTKTITQTDRINKMTGTIQLDGANKVISIDTGPGYDPQVYTGMVSTAAPGSIAYALAMADGMTATVSGKVVVADNADFPGALYLEEKDRTGGIRIIYSDSVGAVRGSLVNVTGTMSTGSDGERELVAGTDGVTLVTAYCAVPRPLGLGNRDIGGSAFNNLTPGITYPINGTGLYNKGVLIKAWGKVTYIDSSSRVMYIDDGSGLSNGTGNPTGLKVTWTAEGGTTLSPTIGAYITDAVGVCGSENAGSDLYQRVLKVRNIAIPVVNAEPMGSAVNLSWEPQDNTGYRVYRSTSSSGPYSLLTTTGAGSYRDGIVTNNTTYY